MNPGPDTILVESELQRGLDCGEVIRVYQAVVDLSSGAPRYVEALLRWDHPTRGLLWPRDFLPDGDADGVLQVRVGWSVLIEAARRARRWRTLRPDRPLAVSVNLAPSQLEVRDLAARIGHLLDDNELEPGALALELSERTMSAGRRARDKVAAIRNLGVEIVVDDLGAALGATASDDELAQAAANLVDARLAAAVDAVKLDRRLVERLATTPALLAAVVERAHREGTPVVATAVEHEADALRARAAGFDLAQGFFFHRPSPPEHIDALVARP